jgi:hypothetical protein
VKVVAPSLPGHGFSYRAGRRRCGLVECADLRAGLMTDGGRTRSGSP